MSARKRASAGAAAPRADHTIPIIEPVVFDLDTADPAALRAHFESQGYVVFKVLDDAACDAQIKRQVTDIFLKQPWQRLLEVVDPDTHAVLDIERDTAAYLAELQRPGLDKETRERYHDAAPFHSGFGAACDPQVFHLPEVWELRQDPRLYRAASAVLGGRTDLWVDVNRSIQLMPGKGDDEFLHWDIPFFFTPYAPDTALGGKVMFNHGGGFFVCVPGSNTAEMHAAIRAAYMPLYPEAKPTDAKFGLDPKKPDPLGLIAARRAVRVGRGCGVFWSTRTLHGVQRNPAKTGWIQFGTYVGFYGAGSRAEYKRRCGVDETDDRVGSYLEGRAPIMYPSYDRIHYYPFRYQNFPEKQLGPYVAKTRPDWPGLSKRTLQSGPNKGKLVDHMVPVLDPHYVPPPLTELGERLLGLQAWPAAAAEGGAAAAAAHGYGAAFGGGGAGAAAEGGGGRGF